MVATDEAGAAAVLEKHTIAPIPLTERHGRPRDLFTIWFSSNVMPLTFVTGALATAVYGLSLPWAVVAIVVGNGLGAFLMALHSAQGPRLGVPQMIQSRGQFGYIGANLVVGIAIIMYVGFATSNLVLGGQALNALSPHISVDAGAIVCAAISLVITTVGYDLIHKINRWLVPVAVASLIIGFVAVPLVHGISAKELHAGSYSFAGFLGMVSIGALWQIAYAPYVSDYSRYMHPEEKVSSTFWNSYWGCNLGSIVPMILGALVGLLAATNQVAALDRDTGGIGWLLMIIFFVAITNTNALNLYGGMLCTITFGQTFRSAMRPGARARAGVSVAIMVVSVLIATAIKGNFLADYNNFDLLLFYFLIPWTAINLLDFYLVRRGRYDVGSFFQPDGGVYGRFDVRALVAYAVGVAVEVPFWDTPGLYVGPLAKDLQTDISWLVGLAVTVPLYLLIVRARRERTPEAVAVVA
ncbi:cytosine permease [Acidimicrobiaceae bacterium USS-CC1]|uniref:Cytosine permease n=1 Tax=Acidiferrimicrobium australe TaxID=2664430 RepID=A0ABW9QQF9_9ACTN|nr:cytosine permease [Acidiferrimicrobium australe]